MVLEMSASTLSEVFVPDDIHVGLRAPSALRYRTSGSVRPETLFVWRWRIVWFAFSVMLWISIAQRASSVLGPPGWNRLGDREWS